VENGCLKKEVRSFNHREKKTREKQAKKRTKDGVHHSHAKKKEMSRVRKKIDLKQPEQDRPTRKKEPPDKKAQDEKRNQSLRTP